MTFDGISVFFSKNTFEHAFFESSKRNRLKDRFSKKRAERMDWIEATLSHPDAQLFQGWNRNKKKYDPNWRVNVVYEDFVVVLKIRKRKDGTLSAEFRTAYKADNSIDKIIKSPKWDRSLVK